MTLPPLAEEIGARGNSPQHRYSGTGGAINFIVVLSAALLAVEASGRVYKIQKGVIRV